jgi:hypothetical protein
MKNQELQIIDPKEYGLEEKKASEIEKSFLPKQIETTSFVEQYETIVNSELTPELIKPAKELRLKLVKVRTGIAEIHKVEKAFFLASGKYVDALKNKLTLPVEQMEEQLANIEKHFENLEKERKATLKAERIKAFEPYGTDVSFMPLDEMTEEQFTGQLEIAITAFDAKKEAERVAELARLESEKKAEAERLQREKEEAERVEAQRLENERLKKEAEEREAELKKEREENAKIQAKKDEEAKKEADRLAGIAKAEKEKSDKLAKEIQDKKDAELKAEQAEQKRLKDLENAGDKEKFKEFFNMFKAVGFPQLKNKQVSDNINAKLAEVVKFMVEQSKSLV